MNNNMMSFNKIQEMMSDHKQVVIHEEDKSNLKMKNLDLRKIRVFRLILEKRRIEINNQDRSQNMNNMNNNFWVKSQFNKFQ